MSSGSAAPAAKETQKTKETEAQRNPKAVTKRRWDHVLGYHFVACLMRLWFKIYASGEIIGIENVPKSGPLLVAANHVSNLDPLMGWAAVYGTRRMWGMAKSELYEKPASAYLMACIGTIPVHRGAGDRAALRRALELLSVGEAVGLFPEGTRSADGRLGPPQPGIGLLALKSGAPVLPVAILGTQIMLPRGAKKLKRVPLKLVFGRPLTIAPNTKRDEIAYAVMQAVAELLTAHGQPTDPPERDFIHEKTRKDTN